MIQRPVWPFDVEVSFHEGRPIAVDRIHEFFDLLLAHAGGHQTANLVAARRIEKDTQSVGAVSEEMLRAAAATGAAGYLLKSDAEELLMAALHRLKEGQCFVSPAFDPDLAKQLFG